MRNINKKQNLVEQARINLDKEKISHSITQCKVEKLETIIKEAREVLKNKREKMTNQLLCNGCCDYKELLYQVDEEIGRILDKVEENSK